MPAHDPRAIANEFLQRNEGPMNQIRLQKLVYIAHGWNLAINHEPLVSGRIEAWDGGPVMRSIWNHMRDFGYGADDLLCHNKSGKPYAPEPALQNEEREVINHVWARYGQYSGSELSVITHRPNTPWSKAYFKLGRNSALSDQDIKQHFIDLAMAGRKQHA